MIQSGQTLLEHVHHEGFCPCTLAGQDINTHNITYRANAWIFNCLCIMEVQYTLFNTFFYLQTDIIFLDAWENLVLVLV